MKAHRALVLVSLLAGALAFAACVSEGPGSDFDRDGLSDETEDRDDDFDLDPGESDFLSTDTDFDGCCDGLPSTAVCDGVPEGEPIGCEDCNNNGFWEPCLNETDPLNDDTDDDGVNDRNDPSPLDGIDCSGGVSQLPYGGSLPPGKPFPTRPAPTATATAVPPTPTPTP